ncbi:MAG: DUF3108 domain-containing protein [Bacteroidales bacterium]|nr:DUF3108 domain-containing protein [Bacteroidales bacterium]
MDMKNRVMAIVALLLMVVCSAQADTYNIKRTQTFKSGETLKCNFYFNWNFIWIKVGEASLTIRDTIYNGQKAKCMKLLSSTNKKADSFFRMRDTLMTVFTDDYKPIYYRKASVEGKKYRLRQVWYSYLDASRVKVAQYSRYNDEAPIYKEEVFDGPIYDMMSLLAYARTLDFTSLKKGTRLTFNVASGKKVEKQHLVYRGKKKTKSDDGHEYDCFRVSLITEEDGDEEEIVNFHVTDDRNHLPILLDLVLNFGSAKARLSHMSGVMYPVTAVVD